MTEAATESATTSKPRATKGTKARKPKKRGPMPTRAALAGMTLPKRIAFVLESWDTVTRHLRNLKPSEILNAVETEKNREGGPRMNVLFRLAQRYDMITKNERIQKLVE